ncbi:MAG: radical SAM protein [SAR324 cluster bacterium]|nr:radical SAM protein [SAR324 cluster bacterium]
MVNTPSHLPTSAIGLINYDDPHQRTFKSLRLGITKACNLSCVYCVPPGFTLVEDEADLSAKELIYLTGLIKEVAGITKLRLTGGEPLISPKLEQILIGVKELNFADVGLTTNGVYLKKRLHLLNHIPQIRLNVSLDTLAKDKFLKITGYDKLEQILAGIDEALKLKLPIKINMLLLKDMNADDILAMLDFCFKKNLVCRFIELMKMGHIASSNYEDKFLSSKDLLSLVSNKYTIKELAKPKHSTAIYYQAVNFGKFGIIANETVPFCQDCDRLRLTSCGELYGCISQARPMSLKPLLKLNREKAKAELVVILQKSMKQKQLYKFKGSSTIMQTIGG